MDRLDGDVRAALSETVLDKLQVVFADMAEEEQAKQQAMRVTLEKHMKDIKDLEASRDRRKESWEKEREKLLESADATRHEEQMKTLDKISQMQVQLNVAMEDRETERGKRLAMEQDLKHTLSLLELTEEEKMMVEESGRAMKDPATRERLYQEEIAALSKALAAAAAKQRLLKELKANSQKRMEEQNMATVEANNCGEKVPDNWRRLQDSKPCPNDDLQSLSSRQTNQTLLNEIAMKFGKMKESLMAEFVKKEEEIVAAEQKKRRKLEEKMRKELEKIQKAEQKEQKKREAKMKKEAEKLAKKKAAEKTGENKRPRFRFWR